MKSYSLDFLILVIYGQNMVKRKLVSPVKLKYYLTFTGFNAKFM